MKIKYKHNNFTTAFLALVSNCIYRYNCFYISGYIDEIQNRICPQKNKKQLYVI